MSNHEGLQVRIDTSPDAEESGAPAGNKLTSEEWLAALRAEKDDDLDYVPWRRGSSGDDAEPSTPTQLPSSVSAEFIPQSDVAPGPSPVTDSTIYAEVAVDASEEASGGGALLVILRTRLQEIQKIAADGSVHTKVELQSKWEKFDHSFQKYIDRNGYSALPQMPEDMVLVHLDRYFSSLKPGSFSPELLEVIPSLSSDALRRFVELYEQHFGEGRVELDLPLGILQEYFQADPVPFDARYVTDVGGIPVFSKEGNEFRVVGSPQDVSNATTD